MAVVCAGLVLVCAALAAVTRPVHSPPRADHVADDSPRTTALGPGSTFETPRPAPQQMGLGQPPRAARAPAGTGQAVAPLDSNAAPHDFNDVNRAAGGHEPPSRPRQSAQLTGPGAITLGELPNYPGFVRLAVAQPEDLAGDAVQFVQWPAQQAGAGNGGAICAVDGARSDVHREPRWSDRRPLPWEGFGFGEYIGPFRTPHLDQYRARVDDEFDFVYLLTRLQQPDAYRLYVGDVIQVSDYSGDPEESLRQQDLTILPDGTISLPLVGRVPAAGRTVEQLQEDLNQRYSVYIHEPNILVQVVQAETPLRDLRDSVDARFGTGGFARVASVSPDGTVQLPLIGSVPAVGLSLDELAYEINARYEARIPGLAVTPILIRRAPRFIYVVGEVNRGGRVELTGPTTVVQAISMAEGWRQGANLRQVIVFRRDENWQLMATKLDLSGALSGKRPHPSDEIWLRDSDIVLVPKMPIQRLAEAVDLYVTRTVYAVVPNRGFVLSFDGVSGL